MLGAPMLRPTTAGFVGLEDPPRVSAYPAYPPPAAKPAIAAIQSHLCPPCDALKTPSPPAVGVTLSFRYCVLTMPARACSFTAVMWISTVPEVLFHCIPQTEARPAGAGGDHFGAQTGAERAGSALVRKAKTDGRQVPAGGLIRQQTRTVRPRVARVPVR